MTTFVTGATGYLGSYVVHELLSQPGGHLSLLVRARDAPAAQERLWRAMQLHVDFDRFRELVAERVDLYLGDITEPQLGLPPTAYARLLERTESIVHIAASLNRKSEKACLNVNLRGTLAVIKLAQAASDDHGLAHFSDVSTTAVAGQRQSEVVYEDTAIDWDRADYDPYARSKKFCEHMVHELLPEVPKSVFRPSMVIGDSRFAQTTQFDMVSAFAFLARLPVIPIEPNARIDTVPADYVARAIVAVHRGGGATDRTFHLSAGQGSQTAAQIVQALRIHGKPLTGRLVGELEGGASRLAKMAAQAPRGSTIGRFGSMMRVFWPYITFDTVFDNQRIVEYLGHAPPVVTEYMSRTLEFAIESGFKFPYKPWPDDAPALEVWSSQA
ncbi:MAG: SDR family oxidoreductase [Myxococcales bacterium]|nr:SDR family oxidoreductase [Myxococcales bacterium]